MVNVVLNINPTRQPKLGSLLMNDTFSFIATASAIFEKQPINPTDDVTAATTKFKEHPAIAATSNKAGTPATPKFFVCADFFDRLKDIFNDTIAMEAINSFDDHTDRELAVTNHLTQLWQNITISWNNI